MKKTIISTIIFLFSLTAFAQQKDSTVQMTVTLNDYRALRSAIDGNIDSKKAAKDILDFMDKHAALLPPPKQDTLTNKQLPKK